jgi:acetyl-CoA carboxylase carboxyl transferase subunit alpha
MMMENAYYSVISPEGCAAILWKHRQHAPEAAEAMKIAAPDLGKLNLIDEVIPEPRGGAHHDHVKSATNFRDAVLAQIKQVQTLSTEEMLDQRYQKFRKYGDWNGDAIA